MRELAAIMLMAPLAMATESSAESSTMSKSSSSPHVVELSISRSMNNFLAQVGVGNPPQKIKMAIDTGSAFTWVRLPDMQKCWDTVGYGDAGTCPADENTAHIFNSHASSSYKPDRKKLFAAYRNNQYIQGYQSSESLSLNGTTIQQLQISMVQNSTMDTDGVLGLGYPIQSSQKRKKKSDKKETLLDKMLAEGAIKHKAYSLYFNDDDAATGSLLFGGMDISKFIGSMKELPIAPHKDAKCHAIYQVPQVTMTSLEMEKRSLTFYHAAILDSSSRISYLPQGVFKPILELIQNSGSNGADNSLAGPKKEGQMVQFVDCKVRDILADKNVVVGFGGIEGVQIDIPLRSLIRPAPGCNEGNTDEIQDESGPPLMDTHCPCYLAIAQSPKTAANSNTEIMVLGDAILRYAYVVYDLQNNVIGMAQRNLESKTSNIVEFEKGMKNNPGAQSIRATTSAASRPNFEGSDSAFWALMVIFVFTVVFA